MGIEVPGYKIIRTLGRGGMATVYLAEQEIFERQVALKVMSKALAEDESFGKRFFREAKIVSQLVHPNIVTVHDVGVHAGYYYLSMEYIDGSDLKQLRGELSLRQKIQAVIDIAKALEYAGAKGYVHRDIKPENIMFYQSDGRAVLTDFGIARAAETDTSMTQTGTAIGTPHYMSPEQAKGKAVDPRSDLYSLGVVFFLLLTGHVPYDAESAVAIGIKHITEPVPLLPDGMDALQPIIDTLLAKKPEARYQDAREFIEDLSRIDLRLLEKQVQYARAELFNESVTDLPTQQVVAAEASTISVVYDSQDTIINDRGGFLSWFLGLLIFTSLAAWVLYYQKPEWVVPWFEQGKAALDKGVERTREWIESLSTEPEQQDESTATGTGEPVDRLEANTAIAEKKSPKFAPGPIQPKPVPTAKPTPELNDTARPLALPVVETGPAEVGPARSDRITSQASESRKTETTTLKPPEPEATPTPEPPPAISLEEYAQKINAAQGLYQRDSALLPDLVAWHRKRMADYPDYGAGTKAFAQLQAAELAAVARLIDEGKTDLSLKKLAQLRVVFPELSTRQLARLEDRAEKKRKIENLLVQAENYFKHRQLTTPAGKNALENFNQVLALDSKNRAAQKGRVRVADALADEARKRYQKGQLSAAVSTADRALAIVAGHESASNTRLKAASELARREKIATWFVNAEQRLNNGQYFSPENDSAYFYYQQILTLDPQNQRASRGQDQVVDGLARSIWTLVGREQFDDARSQLATGLRYLPRNQRLQSLSQAVEEVLADKISSP